MSVAVVLMAQKFEVSFSACMSVPCIEFQIILIGAGILVMCRLTTGIRYEKHVITRFHHCANIVKCTYTHLHSIAYYANSLYGKAYCS